jgi:hypothetical protein
MERSTPTIPVPYRLFLIDPDANLGLSILDERPVSGWILRGAGWENFRNGPDRKNLYPSSISHLFLTGAINFGASGYCRLLAGEFP